MGSRTMDGSEAVRPRGGLHLLRSCAQPRGLVAAALAIFAGVAWAGQVRAQCLQDAREVKLGAGSVRLVSYLCRAPGAASPVRIGFYRLSEAAAGSLLSGKPWAEIARLLGKGKLIDTAPGREAANLFRQFGRTETHDDSFQIRASAAGGSEAEPIEAGTGAKALTYITYPDAEGGGGQPISLPDADATIKTTSAWGPEFRFYYRNYPQCTAPEALECAVLWRYLTAEDVVQFEARAKREQEALGLDANPGMTEIDGVPVATPSEMATPGAEQLPLIQYLTKDGWPEDFITVVGGYSICGGVDFQYFPRKLVVDIAVIENAGAREIALGELLGSTIGGAGLRPEQPARPAAGGALAAITGPVGTLAAGQRVLVPLRLNFVSPDGLLEAFSATPAEAQNFYAMIAQRPPGSLIVEPREGDPQIWEGMAPPLQKTRESYLPPEAPNVGPYVFGPELALQGLTVDGVRVSLTEESANYLELTASSGGGSCPFLYAFDETARDWINYGKVIDEANAESKRMTQEVKLAGPAFRFRLAEEELEMSMIDRAALILKLRSGQSRVIETADVLLAKAEGRERTIVAGQAVEFSFPMPADVQMADIEETYLSITGYYRRYGSMQLSGLTDK